MKTFKLSMAALVMAVGLSGTAQAELQGRDLNGSIDSFEAYYDTDLNITWLADANYGAGSIYDDGFLAFGGGMTWASANAWAANLSFTDTINNITYDNWRLPSTLQYDASCSSTSYEYGCTGSELGHLFYVAFGGVAGESHPLNLNANYILFDNIMDVYWSMTAGTSPSVAWTFDMDDGRQAALLKTLEFRAWAVSSGDVGIAAIPEANTWAMMLAGLGLIGAAVRRRKTAEV